MSPSPPSLHPSSIDDESKQPIGALFGAASEHISTLIRGEVELAKAEIATSAKRGGIGAGLFGAAGAMLLFSVTFLFVAIAEALVALGLPRWVAYLIVWAFFVVLAGLLVLIGLRLIKKVKAPERTIETLKDSKELLSRQAPGARGPGMVRAPGDEVVRRLRLVRCAQRTRHSAAPVNPRRADRPDASSVLLDGPWAHNDYSTNGVRLHVAEAGSGPLVVLLHGFPQFWWAWRHQIVTLADAGYRVVAPDLRGFGASDKPPRKYDAMTTAADIARLVTAMGEREATLVGHDLGGSVAWTVARFRPDVVRRLIVLSAPHPRRWRAALVSDFKQLAASTQVFGFQAPRVPEQRLTRDGAAEIGRLIDKWAGNRWASTVDFTEARARYRQAMMIPQAAYGAVEHYRWAVRSLARPDGITYTRRMSIPVGMPTLQLHGGQDTCVLPTTAQGSSRYVSSTYEWQTIAHAGHFLPEEVPDLVSGEILRWIKT